MKLEKLILVNWGALNTQEYSMGSMTLLTGATGSGKSTMLDALQTVMTATYKGIYNYNPGQDETTQNSRNKTVRTLPAYIVGAEDNLFARPGGAHGYIAAVFKPSENEIGKSFTAVISASAVIEGTGNRRQAVLDKLVLLIVDNTELCLEDFAEVKDGQRTIIAVDKIDATLNLKYRGRVNNYRESKKEYLCQLYGRFRGKTTGIDFPETEQAARAWVQAIAQKPIGSINDLVKNQILEYDEKQVEDSITQISELMRQISNLKNDGERLTKNIGLLSKLEVAGDKATKAHETALKFSLVDAKYVLKVDDTLANAARAAIVELQQNIAIESQKALDLSKDKDGLTKAQTQIQAQLLGIPVAEQKRNLGVQLSQHQERTKLLVKSLSNSVQSAEQLTSVAVKVVSDEYSPHQPKLMLAAAKVKEALIAAESRNFSDKFKVLKAYAEEVSLDHQEIKQLGVSLEEADATFDSIFRSLANPENSFISVLQGQLGELSTRISETNLKERDAARRKANLVGGGTDYPKDVLYALTCLRTELAGARPMVLCDVIEPLDEAWQPAIEGYLGSARFNFIVDKEWERRAIEFIREKKLRATIIQGGRCMKVAREDKVAPNSIIHEISTDNPIAKAYLMDQFGGVIKISDVETLRETKRGVMQDGKASSSGTLFVATAHSLVFGIEAKRNALAQAEKEHAEVELTLARFKKELVAKQNLLSLVGYVSRPVFSVISELERAVRDIELTQEMLKSLDLTEVAELEAQSNDISLRIKGLETQMRTVDQSIGGLKSNIRQNEKELDKLRTLEATKLLKVDNATKAIWELCRTNGRLSLTSFDNDVEELLAKDTLSREDISKQISENKAEAQRYFWKLRESVQDYNSNARGDECLKTALGIESSADSFNVEYSYLVLAKEEIASQFKLQSDSGLVRNIGQLRTAEVSFRDVFTKEFCYRIRNAIDNGVKTLKLLNVELNKLKFGTDRFHIDWDTWVPEYKEYYAFFCAAYDLCDSQEATDLFGTTELSPENCKIRDKLLALLLGEDKDKAIKELKRIADYRNYREYEIWKISDTGSKVALSEWGTGSGGQLETPAYIIRAAVVTNRLKHFDKGSNLRMMVNDESFSKMDEGRAHDVLRLMRDGLGMQLICAMPTNRAGAIKSEFSKEWSFSRTVAGQTGEVGFVSEPDERDLYPDSLRELWDARRTEARHQGQLVFEVNELLAAK